MDGHTSGQARSWTSAQEQGDVGELSGEGVRAACVSAGQGRGLLGERPAGAPVVAAHETTCPQIEQHPSASDRAVRERPLVGAVHSGGFPPAPRAGSRDREGPYNRPNLGLSEGRPLDLHPDTRQKYVSDAFHIHHTGEAHLPAVGSTPESATEPKK